MNKDQGSFELRAYVHKKIRHDCAKKVRRVKNCMFVSLRRTKKVTSVKNCMFDNLRNTEKA